MSNLPFTLTEQKYNHFKKTKILGAFHDLPDNKVAICYIIMAPHCPAGLLHL